MAFASFDNRSAGAPMAEINMVPLIDVMLVLLVIFIITAPMMSNAVKLDLPQTSAAQLPPEKNKIELSIDATGALFWDGELIDKASAISRRSRDRSAAWTS